MALKLLREALEPFYKKLAQGPGQERLTERRGPERRVRPMRESRAPAKQ